MLALLSVGTAQAITFLPKTDFATGAAPHSVAIGDFNGDVKPDLAVANNGASTVSILLGTSTGSFGAKTDFATGGGPAAVAIGDFNGDAKPDLAVANFSGTVSVLLGTGTGSFGAKTDFATGVNPNSVAIGDFSGDGKPDLAVANNSASTVSVLLQASALDRRFAYVPNCASNNVSVLDLSSNAVIATIAVGTCPEHVVFTPTGENAYVTNLGSNTVSVIDTGDYNVVKTVAVGTNPFSLDVAPDGTKVYVANAGSKDVSIIDTATDNVVGTFTNASLLGPMGVRFNPGGSEVWVGCGGGNNCIKRFSYPSNADIGTIPGIIGAPNGLEFLPDGSFAFANNGCGCCGNLQKISTATSSVVSTFSWNGDGNGLAIAPGGGTLYAGTTGHCGGGGNQIKRFDPSSFSVTGSLPLLGPPVGIAVTGDGRFLYVAESFVGPGAVLAFDTASLTVVGLPIPVGSGTTAIAIAPDSDGDGWPDSAEVAIGKNPFVYCVTMRADINNDGFVNALDLNRLAKYFTQTVPPVPARVDINNPRDRAINGLDLNVLAGKFTHSVTECP